MKTTAIIAAAVIVVIIGAAGFLATPVGSETRIALGRWLSNAQTPSGEALRTDDGHDHGDGHDHDAHDHGPGEEHGADSHAAANNGDGCAAHGLPVDTCPFCDQTRIAKLGMCAEHAVPEALCWICDKKLVSAYRRLNDWCSGHNRPESFCTACNGPRASDKWMALVAAKPESGAATDDQSRLHRAPSALCNTDEAVVHLADGETARRAGLTHANVQRTSLARELICNAEVEYDGNRYAQLASRVAGVVREVRVDLGQNVAAGQPLVVIDSPELASAKADCQQAAAVVALAEKTLAREQSLQSRGISTEREISEAETRLAEARIALTRAEQRLGALGLSAEQIAHVTAGADSGATLTINAPFEGTIVSRSAVIGESVDTARSLFAVADTSRMWLMLDVPDTGAPIAVGQTVEFLMERNNPEPLVGRITWISTEIDHKTRNLKARAEFENSRGLLRAHQFGRARVLLGESSGGLIVPRNAVQWDGCCNVVFVKSGEQEYKPRKVRLGIISGEQIEVLDGLREGETVVAQGSFLLKTEIKKGEIGAGCCPGEVAKK